MIAPNIQRPTEAFVDLDALAFNFQSSKQFIGDDTEYMAVVKADAYGHGAVECSKRLESEGVDWFAVATLEEGVELRTSGIRRPVLLLGGLWPGQEHAAISNDLIPAVFRLDQAEAFNAAALNDGQVGRIHVKIDTGMGRIGFNLADIYEVAKTLSRLENIEIDGLMTHFAAADTLAETAFTKRQMDNFNKAVEVFRACGIEPKYLDLANSPAAVAYPGSRSNLVRLGGILYGLSEDMLPAEADAPELRPVMSLRSKIAMVKRVPKGESVGYGRTFVADRDSLVAVIPIGYHDGFRRSLSNTGKVIINGEFAPVIGRISMDWTTVDVTDIPNVKTGDSVTLIGRDGNKAITAADVARAAGTISYEITCGIGPRVPKLY